MSTTTRQPKFQSVPVDYWEQTVPEKIICFIIVILIIALSAVFLYVMVLWTMSTSSTTFGHIWFGIGTAFFFGIVVINSFQKPSFEKLELRLKDSSLLYKGNSTKTITDLSKLVNSKTMIGLKGE